MTVGWYVVRHPDAEILQLFQDDVKGFLRVQATNVRPGAAHGNRTVTPSSGHRARTFNVSVGRLSGSDGRNGNGRPAS